MTWERRTEYILNWDPRDPRWVNTTNVTVCESSRASVSSRGRGGLVATAGWPHNLFLLADRHCFLWTVPSVFCSCHNWSLEGGRTPLDPVEWTEAFVPLSLISRSCETGSLRSGCQQIQCLVGTCPLARRWLWCLLRGPTPWPHLTLIASCSPPSKPGRGEEDFSECTCGRTNLSLLRRRHRCELLAQKQCGVASNGDQARGQPWAVAGGSTQGRPVLAQPCL